jgi:hypothetical protein
METALKIVIRPIAAAAVAVGLYSLFRGEVSDNTIAYGLGFATGGIVLGTLEELWRRHKQGQESRDDGGRY